MDDNIDSANSLGELLELWGHQTQVVHDGPGAIKAVLEFLPALVLLDIGLPGMNGYEVARQLRQETALEGTVLVALTGYGMEEDYKRSAEACFAVHLTKPIDLAALKLMLPPSPKNMAKN